MAASRVNRRAREAAALRHRKLRRKRHAALSLPRHLKEKNRLRVASSVTGRAVSLNVIRNLRALVQPGLAVVAAAILLPLMLFGLAAWESRRATIRDAEQRVDQIARILEEHALKVFETHRLAIQAVDGRLSASGMTRADDEAALHRFLTQLQAGLDQVAAITLIDAAGHIEASGLAFPVDRAVDFSDREWFQALRRHGMALPFISRSYAGRLTGDPVFVAAGRTPDGPGGTFSGTVAVTVNRSYFEQFYRAVETTYDHSVILLRSDGEILAADPPLARTALKRGSTMLRKIDQAPVGTYANRSNVDGVERFFAYRKIGAYPLYVRFGISREAALAPWFSSLRVYGVVAALASFALIAAAAVALRQTRRERAARRSWQDAAHALETAAEERARMETQMRQLQKMDAVGQLTGGIAHDFNNMLAIIIGGLNLVQRRLARGDRDVQKFVDAAMDGAMRAANLTHRLLAFSRQQPLQPEPLSANDLVSGLSELLRRTIGETVALETVLAGGLWKTTVDPSQLENAVLNLAVNARDAMPDGGKLTIETANAHLDDDYAMEHGVASGQYVLVAVSDTGTGMTPDVIAKAFDPFFTTKEIGKGTGLGLSQAYGFVRQSHGHIKIYSEVGHGTTFKVYLPRYLGEAVATARAAPAAGAHGGCPEEIILVVEDEDRVRLISVDALRELGYTVVHASSGTEALDLLRSHPDVTLLFTDIVMPGMTGRQLADAVKRRHPNVKVLFTTGYTRNAVAHNDILDPGTHLLTKPFSLEQLALKTREVLDA